MIYILVINYLIIKLQPYNLVIYKTIVIQTGNMLSNNIKNLICYYFIKLVALTKFQLSLVSI